MPGAVSVPFVDLYVLRWLNGAWETLLLRRAAGARSTGAWEAVHGRVEPSETPVEAAVRELLEETGLAPSRLYNLSRTESFYLHATNEVALIPVFAAVVPPDRVVVLSVEHDSFEWAPLDRAASRFAWPRERRAILDAQTLLFGGDAGFLESVLRVLPPA